MDVSTEQDGEIWINQAFGISSIPPSRREYYPFSRGAAFVYRLKLGVVLLNTACALWWVEEPCHRLSLLLNCWLLFVTCESVFKNYPWREPLTVWMWQFYWAVPCSRVLLSIWIVLLLLFLTYLGTGCKLTHHQAVASVAWLCCMAIWPLIRERWRREERSEEDYDQFSYTRPCLLMLPAPFGVILATLRSPSLFALLAAFMAASITTLFLSGLIADIWMVSTGAFTLGCFAILCCHRLPEDVGRTLAAWEVEETSYARKIENSLRIAKGHLRTSGLPSEGSARFDRLAVQVPLLLREAKLLRNASRAITESRAKELKELTTAGELVEFHEMLDCYGPYTTECCIS